MARVIFDTGVVVAAARGKLELTALSREDNFALSAVTIAEYLSGVHLDPMQQRRAVHRAFLDELRDVAPIIEYTSAVAEHHAELLAHVHKSGQKRGAHDLLIAATARATDRVLVTTDRKARFDELPKVQVRVIEQ